MIPFQEIDIALFLTKKKWWDNGDFYFIKIVMREKDEWNPIWKIYIKNK
jgi:hypothetical protein